MTDTPAPFINAATLKVGCTALSSADFLLALPGASNDQNPRITQINGACTSDGMKVFSAAYHAAGCCSEWEAQVTALAAQTSCTTAHFGDCEIDTSNQVIIDIKLALDTCGEYNDARMNQLTDALSKVLEIPKFFISAPVDTACSKGGKRRLLAVDIAVTVNAPDADAASRAEEITVADLNAELPSDMQAESLTATATNPTIDTAANLAPSIILGLMGLVASRFATKA
eukprot:121976-Rhodomonas_salina.1